MFLTHLHDDHTADLAAMLAHQWTGSKATPTHVYGPYATARTVEGALAFFRANVEIRTVDEGRTTQPEELFFGHDVDVGNEPSRVFADEQRRRDGRDEHALSRALRRAHAAPLARLPLRDEHALDLLLGRHGVLGEHRAASRAAPTCSSARSWTTARTRTTWRAPRKQAAAGNPESVFRHVAETHSTPSDVGRMAAEAEVKTVVLNHQLRGQAAQGFTISSFIDGVRAVFDGNVIVGEDQLVI